MCSNWFMFRVSSQRLPITCLLLIIPFVKYDMQPQSKVVPVSTNWCKCWGCNYVTHYNTGEGSHPSLYPQTFAESGFGHAQFPTKLACL